MKYKRKIHTDYLRYLRLSALIVIFMLLSKVNVFAQYDLTKWDSLKYQTPEWYQDAKLGIYPHFGVYSQAAFGNEWYGYSMYDKPHALPNWIPWTYQHHCSTYGDPSTFGYKNLVPLFKAENFDADDFINYVVNSGAKYFAHLTSHHDAFLMYGSKLSRWNSVDMGPKKDFGLLFQAAAKKRGLRFGISNHLAENNWFFQTNWTNKFDASTDHSLFYIYNDSIGTIDRLNTPPSDRWCTLWTKISKEMIDYLQPDYIYYDRGWSMHPKWTPYRKDLVLYYYNKAIEWGRGTYGAPGVALLYKDDGITAGGAIYDQEAGVLGSIQPLPFQSDFSISNQWGYVENDSYKSTSEIVNLLVDIVSKNGNLMLSINPKGDGTLPEQTKQRLTELGNWMALNGEGIYASRPFTTFGLNIGSNQIRFTRNKDNTVTYVFSSIWPGNNGTLSLTSLNSTSISNSKISKIVLLGKGETVLNWTQNSTALSITMPSTIPTGCNANCYVFKIYLDKAMTELAKPSNLTSQVAPKGIALKWVNCSTKATGYAIERKKVGSDTFIQIDTVPNTTITYSDTLLNSTGTYVYRIRSYNSTGYSSYSNETSTLLESLVSAALKVDGGTAQNVSTITVNVGQSVELTPVQIGYNTGTWNWSNGNTTQNLKINSIQTSEIDTVTYTYNGTAYKLVYKIFVSVPQIADGDYFIKDVSTGLYYTNDGSLQPSFGARSTATPLSQSWKFSKDATSGRYKIVSNLDNRFMEEHGRFNTSAYFAAWNSYSLSSLLGVNLFAIQNGGDAGTKYWGISGSTINGMATTTLNGYPFNIIPYGTTGILSISELGYSVYPNPINDFMIVTLGENASQNTLLTLYSVDGHKVKVVRCVSGENNISTSDLPNGLYIGVLNAEGKNKTFKFVKE